MKLATVLTLGILASSAVGAYADTGALAALRILIADHDDARQLARPSQSRQCRQGGDDQQKPSVDAEGVVQGKQSAISSQQSALSRANDLAQDERQRAEC